jgi:hypothetical protein
MGLLIADWRLPIADCRLKEGVLLTKLNSMTYTSASTIVAASNIGRISKSAIGNRQSEIA